MPCKKRTKTAAKTPKLPQAQERIKNNCCPFCGRPFEKFPNSCPVHGDLYPAIQAIMPPEEGLKNSVLYYIFWPSVSPTGQIQICHKIVLSAIEVAMFIRAHPDRPSQILMFRRGSLVVNDENLTSALKAVLPERDRGGPFGAIQWVLSRVLENALKNSRGVRPREGA